MNQEYDFVIIGGGATGLGIAVDATTRGFSVLLVEQADFGTSSSSKSTKLIHGGLRYLKQANFGLVKESLHERTLLLQNAPHLVHPLSIIIPFYNIWEKYFYIVGTWLYDFLTTHTYFKKSKTLSKTKLLETLHYLKKHQLKGGIQIQDGQFNDSRMLISLLLTAKNSGAVVLNYTQFTQFTFDKHQKINGGIITDIFTQKNTEVKSKCLINATGVFTDNIRQKLANCKNPVLKVSKGVHLVLPKKFYPNKKGLLIPKTKDNRIIFILPWQNHTLVGTTDTFTKEITLHPKADKEDITYLLSYANKYLSSKPTEADILAVFSGLRPLVNTGKNSASLSRSHYILKEKNNLITVTGGKWTTYRKMAKDTVDIALQVSMLPIKPCKTTQLKMADYLENPENIPSYLWCYGKNAFSIIAMEQENIQLAKKIHYNHPFSYAQVYWAVKNEDAKTIEDILARRIPLLFIDAKAALHCAKEVATFLHTQKLISENDTHRQLVEFTNIAQNYLP